MSTSAVPQQQYQYQPSRILLYRKPEIRLQLAVIAVDPCSGYSRLGRVRNGGDISHHYFPMNTYIESESPYTYEAPVRIYPVLVPIRILEPQPRSGDKPVKFQVVLSPNGTAVLKGLTRFLYVWAI